ncbi:MAG: RICIN domain-containing protein [Chitinophagales bacterium]
MRTFNFAFIIALVSIFSIFTSNNAIAQEIDGNFYYRITTMWQGTDKALDVINDGQNNQIHLAKTGNYSGQFWKFTALGNGYYRMTTMFQGDEKSLDVVNDGQNTKLHLAKTGNYSGQFWKLTPQGNGYYRMTTMWQGEGKSFDVINDGKNNQVHLAKTGNYSGQFIKLTQLSAVPKPAPKVVNGETTVEVKFGRNGGNLGVFKQVGNTKTWKETGRRVGSSTFTFTETHRDEWSVYLHDQSRNVYIQLDLHTKKVMYSAGNQTKTPLYEILAAN